MSVIRFISTGVRFLIAPIFIGLAFVNYSVTTSTPLTPPHHAATNDVPIAFGPRLSKDDAQILTSMWLMYALMGVAHITPWLGLIGGSKRMPLSDY